MIMKNLIKKYKSKKKLSLRNCQFLLAVSLMVLVSLTSTTALAKDNTKPVISSLKVVKGQFNPSAGKETIQYNLSEKAKVTVVVSGNELKNDTVIFQGYQAKGLNKVTWSGQDQDSNLKDGIYTFRITAVDLAGNPSRVSEEYTRIDTNVELKSYNIASSSIAYPNTGFQANFQGKEPVKATMKIYGYYTYVEYYDSALDPKVQKNFGNYPSKIFWDCRGKDGELVPEQTYNYLVTFTDEAGNQWQSRGYFDVVYKNPYNSSPIPPRPVVVNPQPPANTQQGKTKQLAVLSLASNTKTNAFNPKDGITLTYRTSQAARVIIKAYAGSSKQGTVIFDGYQGAGVNKFTWRGNLGKGLAKDGVYNLELLLVDKAKKQSKPKLITVYIDSTPPEILGHGFSRPAFNPYYGGYTEFGFRANEIVRWSLAVYPSNNQQIPYFQAGRNEFKVKRESVTWNARSILGNYLPGGTYIYKITVYDRAGNSEVKTGTVGVDYEGPKIEMLQSRSEITLIKEQAVFPINLSEDCYVSIRVTRDPYKEIVKVIKPIFMPKGSGIIVWDGWMDNGDPAPAGTYYLNITVTDLAGNFDYGWATVVGKYNY